MTETESQNPEEILKAILDGLRNADDAARLKAIAQLSLLTVV